MRKTFLTESLARLLRGAIGIACLAAACVSCETHSNSDRSESIAVYADPIEKKPVDAVYVGVQGGQAKIYAEANVDFVASWEDDADMPWAAVLDDTAVDPLTGCRIVTLDVQRRVETGCYYTRRTGMLILAATDGTLNYNRIVPVHQGSTARVSNDFSSMKYGKTDPRFTDDETPIDDWTTAQKDYGFSSTTIDGEEHAHCYGKNGYLKLGDDEGHGADLISPYTNTLRSDSMLMVSFRAVAYTDFYTGAKDDNKIKVEVLDGGVIADFADTGKTSIELEAAYYDPRSDEFPEKHVGGKRPAGLRGRNAAQSDYGQHAHPHQLRLVHPDVAGQQPHLPRQFLHPPPRSGRRELLYRKQRQRQGHNPRSASRGGSGVSRPEQVVSPKTT